MNVLRILSTSLVLSLLAFSTTSTFATNGYFTHGNGTKNKGQAGAGIASPDEALAITNNPAATLWVGNRIDVGAALFNPRRNYTSGNSLAEGNGGAFTIGPNTLDSGRKYFVIPHIAKTTQLNKESAWGIAFYGRGGMNTRWDGGTASFDPDGPAGPAPVMTLNGSFGSGRAGIDLSQAFLDLSYARKISEKTNIGVSAVFALQAFEADGLEAFGGFTRAFNDNILATGQPNPTVVNNLTGNGHEYSFGYGAKIGIHSKLSESISLAAMYQSEIAMSEFDNYSDLFAEAGDFDIPANAKLGLSIKANDRLSYSFDLEHTWFSNVNSVGNSIANIISCPTANGFSSNDTSGCLGGSNGAGFGWDDMTVYKAGVEWSTNDTWTWRAGYSHGNQPIPESEVLFNILAPGVIEDHLTFGFTKQHGIKNELNFAFMYALDNSVRGTNAFDPSQNIEIEMDQFEIELSYSWTL